MIHTGLYVHDQLMLGVTGSTCSVPSVQFMCCERGSTCRNVPQYVATCRNMTATTVCLTEEPAGNRSSCSGSNLHVTWGVNNSYCWSCIRLSLANTENKTTCVCIAAANESHVFLLADIFSHNLAQITTRKTTRVSACRRTVPCAVMRCVRALNAV